MRHNSTEAMSHTRARGSAMLERATWQHEPLATVGDFANHVLPIPLAVLDREGIILSVNEAWMRLAREDGTATLIKGSPGMNYLDMCDEGSRLSSHNGHEAARGIRTVLRRERTVFTHYYACRTSAQAGWYLLHAASLPDAQGGAVVAHIDVGERHPVKTGIGRLLAREQTARSHAELRLVEAQKARVDAEAISQQLRRLQLITDTALASLTLNTLIGALLDRIREIMAADNVTILLLTEDGQGLTVHTTHGLLKGTGVRVPIGQGVAGRIAASKQPLIIEDLSTADVVNPALRNRMRSLAGVPLLIEGRLIGVLHVDTVVTRRFTQSDIELLQLAAERIAMAIERARLHHLYEMAEARHMEADQRAGQLDTMFEAMTDGMLVCDRKRRVVRANHAYRELMTALNASGTDSTPLQDRLAHLEVRDAHGKRMRPAQFPIQRILRGEVLGGVTAQDLRIQGPDGSERELTASGAPVRDGDGRISGAIAVVRDVTERQQLERRTEQALQALLAMAEVLTCQEGASGTKIGPGADIVARRLAELARGVLGCERICLVAVDARTERMKPVATVGWRPEDEQQWLHSERQLCLSDILPDEQVKQVRAGHVVVSALRDARHRGISLFGMESVLIAPMHIGAECIGFLWADYGVAPHVFGEAERALAGATTHLAGLVLERDRLLHEQEESRVRELALQETTQRMDDFLAIASHDLRSPLTAAIGGVEFAALKFEHLASAVLAKVPDLTESVEAVQRCMNDADQSIMRLSRFVAFLFDTARAQTGTLDLRLEPCDLAALMGEQVTSLRLAHPQRTIQLKQPAGTQVPVVADADRIGEVVSNYLSNALKYSPADQKIVVTLTAKGPWARVSVKDHGPGLAAGIQQRIWERFYRAPGIRAYNGSSSGLGLGLHISKLLVNAHGGQVGVLSREGKGSTFWFTLPLASFSD